MATLKTRNNESWKRCGEKEVCVLLVGLKIDATTMENNGDFSKIKKRSTI